MKGFTLALITLFLSVNAWCQQSSLPLSKPSGNCYTELNQAAIQGLKEAAHQSDSIEYAGVIYQLGNRFCYTTAVTNKDPYKFAIRASFPGTMVAIYHTHPDGLNSDRFSEPDINTARSMNVISFIYVFHTDAVRVFDPHKDYVASQGQLRFSDGKMVLAAASR